MRIRASIVSLVLVTAGSVLAAFDAAPPVFVKAKLGVGNPGGGVETPVLRGEVPGITASHVTLNRDATLRIGSGTHDIVYLVLDGKGSVKANRTPIGVERQMIVRLPVGWSAEWSAAPGATLDLLVIRHELSTEDRADLSAHPENQRAPYVKKFSECPTYGEAIKSAKTTSRTLLPKDIVPRMSIGTVETIGPDRVAAHAHPMLEQFFLGLDGNDIIVHADDGQVTLGAHELLHIPLGSSHGAEVAAGKTLHYVWMDFFRDREGLKWLETHKPNEPKRLLVRSQDEYRRTLEQVGPGDVVVLANGEWRNFEIVFTGKGAPGKPITLTAESPGKVLITGRSNLRISGSHLLVSGLVFRDGYSPTGEVIAFRRNKEDMATDSRVTETVIDHFNQPDRYKSDYWVALDGRRNRFDHNHVAGKSNEGVTLAVRLDNDESRGNDHRIDHNYFGPRPVLGSNGGETIRIGVSGHSMFDSKTVVEDNVFDRCDGEVEIISIKSGANVVRRNLFLESSGAVVLRHGDGNLVERNIFLGKGKPHAGGIRVINRNQVVRGNYMEGLGGTGFASALSVMNGVPNSPLNRYVQVANAVIEHNSIFDSARVTLGAGADAERSAPPVDSRFDSNILSFGNADRPFVLEGDVSGIACSANVIAARQAVPVLAGVKQATVEAARAGNGLLYPTDPAMAAIGAPRDLKVLSLDEVGATYYPKTPRGRVFGQGTSIPVAPGEETLSDAFGRAASGDTLTLAGGRYLVDRTFLVDKTITLQGAGTPRPVISFSRTSLFEMADGGNLQLKDIDITGEDAPDVVGNAIIRTTTVPILTNFVIQLDGVHVSNLTVNKGFDVVAIGKGSMAERLDIANSRFDAVSGRVVGAASETDDYGRYNAEYLSVTKSAFHAIGGGIVSLYRGGTDESTFGPHLLFRDNVVVGSGNKVMAGDHASISLFGVQDALIEGNRFDASAPIKIVHTTGVPSSRIVNNVFKATARPLLSEAQATVPPRVTMIGNSFDGIKQ